MLEGLLIGGVAIVVITIFGIKKILDSDEISISPKKKLMEMLTGNETVAEGSGELIGKIGEVYTVLKPGGKILIDNDIYEASTNGEYLERGEQVKVIGITMGQELKVRPYKEK